MAFDYFETQDAEFEPFANPSAEETGRFGYEFARCNVPIPAAVEPRQVAIAIQKQGAEITVLRYSATHANWFGYLTVYLPEHVIIPADNLIYWELLPGPETFPAGFHPLRSEPAEDKNQIGNLTDRIFEGYTSHYSANPLLEARLIRDGYREWAMTTDLRDSVVLSLGDVPIGLATTLVGSQMMEVLLAGIVPEARRKGMYAQLMRAVEIRAVEQGADRVVISTQAHNTSVQRAWSRYGLLPVATLMTVHVVARDLWKRLGVVDFPPNDIRRP